MRYSLLSISILLILATLLNGCAAPTAVQTPTVPLPTATIAAPATSAPTMVPQTAAPSATRAPASPTPAPTVSTQPTTTPQAQPTASSRLGKQELDLNALLPPGDGRQLLLDNCMNCHSIAPILVSQKTAGEWEGTKIAHEGHMSTLTQAESDQIFGYLAKNFGPDHVVPDLPPDLLSGFTNY